MAISLVELEALLDSSLRLADKVNFDDQSVKGECWLMRNALWVYRPLKIQLSYHVVNGIPSIILFQYKILDLKPDINWISIVDTNAYRSLLQSADVWRRQQP